MNPLPHLSFHRFPLRSKHPKVKTDCIYKSSQQILTNFCSDIGANTENFLLKINYFAIRKHVNSYVIETFISRHRFQTNK